MKSKSIARNVRCQTNRQLQIPSAELHPIPVSDVWKQVGIDMIGPLSVTGKGNKYIITLVDYLSKWPEPRRNQSLTKQLQVWPISSSKIFDVMDG